MATTKVTANVLADDSITQAKLADDAVGAAELASNAVVNASIASGAAIDMDKLDGDSLASAITDFAQDDLVILSDTSDSGNLVKITTSNFEDAIFGNISGDVTLAAGGAATTTATQTNITSVLNTSLVLGRDADNQIKFSTDNQIIFEVDGGDNVIFKTSGEIEASSLDISGDVDVDGTLEADAITINGATLAETISDTVGAMVGSNTETGIAVTYEDGDNTLDFALGAAQTTITSLLATDIKIGEDDQTKIDFETADTINFYAGNEKQLILTDGALTPGSNAIVDLGTDALEFKDAFFDGTVEADAYTVAGTALNEYIADTIGAMVTSNTETGIAVTYEDGDNTLDFVLGTITSLGTISTGVWQGTAIASTYIAADAITGAKIADDAIDSEHYTDGSIDNAHLADDAVGADELAANAVVTASIVDDNITFAKIENRYTELVAKGSHGSAFAIDGSAGCTFTATMTGNATFTLSNMVQGQVIDLVVNGNYTITLAQTGATFNKIGSTDYDGSTTNLIQIVCADDASSEIYYYSVAPYTSDTTP